MLEPPFCPMLLAYFFFSFLVFGTHIAMKTVFVVFYKQLELSSRSRLISFLG